MTDGEAAVPDSGAAQAATYRAVRELLRTFGDSRWSAMTLELDGLRITVGKDGPPAPGVPATPDVPATPAASTPPATPAVPTPPGASGVAGADGAVAGAVPVAGLDGCVPVRSPAVGSFWVAPGPGQPPFVGVGDLIAAGDQLAIVEVMKLMNPVTAPQAGQVAAVCAANADLVEYDEVLFWLRPADD